MKEELSKLPYFTISQLALFQSSRKVALVNISRLLKNNQIKKIREWYYVYESFLNEMKYEWNFNSYLEFIASNIVYFPAYLSLEYVLYENSIITENVYNFTLVTTKKTANFKNDFWNFIYKSIKKEFFDGYEIIKKDGFNIYKATKEKALFDYFYLKKDIIFELSYFEELRLNLENVDIIKFENLVKKYLDAPWGDNNKKLEKVVIFLKKLKWL